MGVKGGLRGRPLADFRETLSLPVARIGDSLFLAIQSEYGIEIWDFTDVDDIHRASKLALPGVNAGDYCSVARQAPYLYVGAAGQYTLIVDAGDPTAPVLADREVVETGMLAVDDADAGQVSFLATSSLWVTTTDDLHFAHRINPSTLKRDDANGTIIYPKHVHKALRRYLGIENTPGAQRFPFNNTEDCAFFG